MFGAKDLKTNITITETTVECPVKGCPEKVRRQRKRFKRHVQFQCPRHRIYISPSTFEYPRKLHNLLWNAPEDRRLLRAVETVKRESRMARDNSEDAVTWNVFRYLEKANQLSPFLSSLTGLPATNPELIYWSYSQRVKGVWPGLARARAEFGEVSSRGSEPDLIVASDNTLFWIEAKLTATNKTCPTAPTNTKRYLTGGNRWYQRIFKSDYETIAIKAEKYELMRFWLLGSWAAAQSDSDFYLINLVLAEREKGIEQSFKQHVKTNARRSFLRLSWEDVYRFVSDNALRTEETNVLMAYFENKTIGYNSLGELQLAFSL